MSMNIAIVNEFFSPYIKGGTEIFLLEFARYLKKKGHKVIVITSEQNQKNSKEFKTYKIKSSPFHFSYRYQFSGITTPWMLFNRKLRKKINEIYEKENIDIVYANNVTHVSFAPIQTDINFVLDVHDYWPVCFSRDLFYKSKICKKKSIAKCAFCLSKKYKMPIIFPFLIPKLFVEKHFMKKTLEKAKEVISHSKLVRGELKKEGIESVVIPYPYMGKKKKTKRKETKTFNILFVGRIDERKGLDIILNIAKELKGKLDYRIDIIGTGPDKLMKKMKRKDLDIHIHGFLKEERFEFFSNADCLLAPSIWPEPFGMVILEAMNFGLPIITMKNTGMSELVEENNAGFSLTEKEIAGKIIEIYKNPSIRKRIEKSDKRNIEKYSKEKLFSVYEEILRRKLHIPIRTNSEAHMGERNGFYGRQHTNESKKRISENRWGNKR
ncbi:MAG: glycosyltransferase [Candidatus Aenigmarchaeota archaeon]|nr:glycosyltransferase [Candidatus Aenigmarchaeota archaeon]